MKIGVVTTHRSFNAGAVLQAYALQSYLQALGHSVEFIDYHKNYKWNLSDFVAKSPKWILHKWRNNYNRVKYANASKRWVAALNVSNRSYDTFEQLNIDPPIYDLYIVGSDQVWNFLRELNYVTLLDFVPSCKRRVSYAASMGQCNIPEALHHELRTQLSKFDFISLRETKGVEFVSKLLGEDHDVYQAVDPTLLNGVKVYDQLLKPIQQDDYIVSYILNMMDQELESVVDHLSKRVNKRLINIRNTDTCVYLNGVKNQIVDPYQWLSYIKNSTFVVCGSFHATVFALLYHRPFVVLISSDLKNKGGNARVNSLLEPMGLLERCVSNIEELDAVIGREIDWDLVDSNIKSRADLSKQYIEMIFKI